MRSALRALAPFVLVLLAACARIPDAVPPSVLSPAPIAPPPQPPPAAEPAAPPPAQPAPPQAAPASPPAAPPPREDCVCIALYEPVCGSDGKTYSNSCYAACSGVESFTPGECPA